MKTKSEHAMYLPYVKMIIEKCNKITGKNLELGFEITETQRGFARSRFNTISIPTWAIRKGFEFFTQYIIHEYCHHYVGFAHGHDMIFKKAEMMLCEKLINVRLIYAKAYVKKIIKIKDNSVAYFSGQENETGLSHIWTCECGKKYNMSEAQHRKVLKNKYSYYHCNGMKLTYHGLG